MVKMEIIEEGGTFGKKTRTKYPFIFVVKAGKQGRIITERRPTRARDLDPEEIRRNKKVKPIDKIPVHLWREI